MYKCRHTRLYKPRRNNNTDTFMQNAETSLAFLNCQILRTIASYVLILRDKGKRPKAVYIQSEYFAVISFVHL